MAWPLPMNRQVTGGARPTVFLLVEIKVREFRAKLLLASKLAEHGFRVYLGSRRVIMDAVTKRGGDAPAGVYYFKGGEPLEALAAVRRACQYVVGQDEEIGPALTPADIERAWKTRYPEDVTDLIDHVYCFADAHVAILREVRPRLAARASATGWPRVDLLRPELRGPDARRAIEIRERLGDFVLFASNFKINSAAQRDHAIAFAKNTQPGAHVEEDRPGCGDEWGSRASHRLASFYRAAGFLRELASTGAGQIVVRPHPSEDPRAWKAEMTGVPNVRVLADGTAAPWLLAAGGVLHAGCTTAVEAALAGIPCGYLEMIGFQPEDYRETASWHVSQPLVDLDDARRFVDDSISASLEFDGQALPSEVFGPQNGLASDRIAASIAALGVTAEEPLRAHRLVALRRIAARVVARARAMRRGGHRFTGTNAQRKLAGGIHRPEARSLLDDLPGGARVFVSEPRFDLLEIELEPWATTRTDDDGPLTVEFAGPPGVGKSTIAGRLQASIASAVRGRLGRGHRRATVRALAALWIRPRRARLALAIALDTAAGMSGPAVARVRRAWKIFKGLARIADVGRGRVLVLDEGPVNWLVTARWHDVSARARALDRLSRLYQMSRCALVVLDADSNIVAARLHGRPAPASRRRRGSPGMPRSSAAERSLALAGVADVLAQSVRVVRVQVDGDTTPEGLARDVGSRLLGRTY